MVAIRESEGLSKAVVDQEHFLWVFSIGKYVVELDVIMYQTDWVNTFNSFNQLYADRNYVSYWEMVPHHQVLEASLDVLVNKVNVTKTRL